MVAGARIDAANLLRRALDTSNFWNLLEKRCEQLNKNPAEVSILIKPDVETLIEKSPTQVSAAFVNAFVDALLEYGYTNVNVGVSLEFDFPWIENRDALGLAEFAGYLDKHGNLCVDLLDHLSALSDANSSVLSGIPVSKTWLDADIRIIVASNKTDQKNGFSLCLNSLLSIISPQDRAKLRCSGVEEKQVCRALVAHVGAHFGIIDAIRSAHGSGGRLSPDTLITNTVIASDDIILADYVGATKMRLSPVSSELFEAVGNQLCLEDVSIRGNLQPYQGWKNVDPIIKDSVFKASKLTNGNPVVESIFQQVQTSLFPISDPLHRVILNELYGEGQRGYGELVPLHLLCNSLLSSACYLGEAINIVANKDEIVQRIANINVDPNHVKLKNFLPMAKALAAELAELELVKSDEDGFRAVCHGSMIKFEITQRFLVDFETFTERVAVENSMQFLNDYIGGSSLPLKYNRSERVSHQIERTIYLPQPNFVVSEALRYLDVTKIEYITFKKEQQRFYWKTIFSENNSAIRDDGIVTFKREGDCTDVTISSVQQLTLPPLWESYFNSLPLVNQSTLTTKNYKRFFLQTMANLEALLEGRSIRIGKTCEQNFAGLSAFLADHPLVQLTTLLKKIVESTSTATSHRVPFDVLGIDECGFKHLKAVKNVSTSSEQETKSTRELFWKVIAQMSDASLLDAAHGGDQHL
ncbi:MAG: DUF362 domain-containing protein [Cyanobacteria bacterium SZAS-4]|nr:DUF362 domain-containing protein [Cyanobacteria bacterium SZAS-4]